MTVNLGQLLLQEKIVLPWQLQEALEYQRRNGGTLTRALVSRRTVRHDEIASEAVW